ncbi:thiaminase II [Helicobacter monodelphidis]|uniref:thiaminase II n=1 Tax=Helicobacter sp. 15-1451 TaxID=2004995 RepID=UPI000DCAFCF0|nr:thiaminase II [Helicobacter sp. 15-1451]RAX57707.1 thiaminase II [Helicobacter sp. 15-1451]
MLFQRLIKENAAIWDSYLHHCFVKRLEDGSLEKEKFLFYLKQDYMYLINYAKCYARLALNADNAKELRFAMKFQQYIIEGEIELHKSILQLGIDVDNLCAKDESITNIAYTRYMLSVGESGDFLDMLVALSACAIGYAYIGKEVFKNSQHSLENHPYREWILTYAGEEFQKETQEFEEFLNTYNVSDEKFNKLSHIFHNVVRLEAEFWQHALEMRV